MTGENSATARPAHFGHEVGGVLMAENFSPIMLGHCKQVNMNDKTVLYFKSPVSNICLNF